MKKISLLSFILMLCTTLILTESCDKAEENLDPCANINCQNGGICDDGTCDCPIGYTGANCEQTDDIQVLLDGGDTPKNLYDGGVILEQLYGKTYEGGLIFYLNTDNGTGMVAAIEDQSVAEWGCSETTTGAVGETIGAGSQNTIIILSACQSEGIAAKLCDDLNLNDKSDWFLPSKDELNLMYTNLHVNGHGGFAADFYWSSTEDDSDNAWKQLFSSGNQFDFSKFANRHVRAGRTF